MKKSPYIRYYSNKKEGFVYLPKSLCVGAKNREFLKNVMVQIQRLHMGNEYEHVQYFDGKEVKEIDTQKALDLVSKYVIEKLYGEVEWEVVV